MSRSFFGGGHFMIDTAQACPLKTASVLGGNATTRRRNKKGGQRARNDNDDDDGGPGVPCV